MGNYKDRGILKWTPYESLEGRQNVLEELIFSIGKKEMSTLSSDEEEEIDNNLKKALEENKMISISYYYDGYTYSTLGKIHKIDPINRTILLDTEETINLDDVLRLDVIER